MIGTLLLILILSQYALTAYCLVKRQYTGLVMLLIYSQLSYDFVFINASYYLPKALVLGLKLYSEYLLCYFLFNFLVLMVRNQAYNRRLLWSFISLMIVPSLIIFCIHDLPHGDFYESSRGMRLYLFPILLPYLMLECGWFRDIDYKRIIWFVVALCVAAGIYGLYQQYSFPGSITDLWFYDFFNENGVNVIADKAPNYIRDGALRVTSVFVSPLTYSTAMFFPIAFILALLFFEKNQRRSVRILYLLLGIFFVYCQLTAQTRTALILDVLALVIIALLRFRRSLPFSVVLAVPFALVLATFGLLLSGSINEPSALGRLTQYGNFPKYFQVLGMGFYDPQVQTYFDGYYLSLGLLYGLFTPLIILLIFLLTYIAYKGYQRRQHGFSVAVVALCMTFVYAFTFQFVGGTAAYKLFFLLLFMIIPNERDKQAPAFEADRGRTV